MENGRVLEKRFSVVLPDKACASVKLSREKVFCTGDLVLPSAGGSWFGAGGFVYFCPELLFMMAILKYIVSE